MLDTKLFVSKLIEAGISHLCVVPCSFAKNFINASINVRGQFEYLPCASEAVACSVAAGLVLSGKQPLVIVQSSGLTNMGSCITSLLKPYDIKFPILVSWRTYKEGDSEIQHAHLATKLPDLVAAYGYDYGLLNNNCEDSAVAQIVNSVSHTKILLLQKDSFSKVDLDEQHVLDLSKYPERSQYLKYLNSTFSKSKTVFVGTTGNTAREMYSYMPETDNLYIAGNMGGALSVGLGIAKGGRDVVVCGGDAEFVMHMGAVTTAGRYKNIKSKLLYLLFDNESNKSTGGQRTYQDHVDFIGIVRSSGFRVWGNTVNSLQRFKESLESYAESESMFFIHVKCSYDLETPRPPLEVVKRNLLHGVEV